MKKKAAIILAGLMAVSFAGCGAAPAASQSTPVQETEMTTEKQTETEAASTETGLANPWHEITEEEADAMLSDLFTAPEGAEDVIWSVMESEDTSPLIELQFTLDGLEFTARSQMTGDEKEDISGMNYEWIAEDEVTLSNWAGGAMIGETYRYIGDDGYVDLCTWYNVETGQSYSLSVTAEDLDGFDILAIAEAIYAAAKDSWNQIPDEEEAMEEEHVPTDISGCDTFTQIVDKLDSGMGYANVTIGDTDVLLVCSETYPYDGEGSHAAIDAEVYRYGDDGPEYVDYLECGGTAYPLVVVNGDLYVGGNHGVMKYTMKDGELLVDEGASVEYDENGGETYYVYSDTKDMGGDAEGKVADDSVLTRLFDEINAAGFIEFSEVA